MDKIRIIGGQTLSGSINISGAKNAALPIMASSILTDQKITLNNFPDLSDVHYMGEILSDIGVDISHDKKNQICELQTNCLKTTIAPYDKVKKMRASILVLGPLLARYGKCKIALPGGCAIGNRSVDLHLKAMKLLGAEISIDQGYINATVPGNRLVGAQIVFPVTTVCGTENAIMAAVLAKGETLIVNAAQEPEIINMIDLLNKMGAKIEGNSTSCLKIIGVDSLNGASIDIIPDRIEAITYVIGALATKSELRINYKPNIVIKACLDILRQSSAIIEENSDHVLVKSIDRCTSSDIITEPYPGFPTDLQAQFMSLMCIAAGNCIIEEKIFENRFMHVAELNRMGAAISIHGHVAFVHGVDKLSGTNVAATDLRASACLIIAGLAATGETIIDDIYHINRGYDSIVEKLSGCGAIIDIL